MPVISRTHFRLVSTHICFNLLLLLPAALEVLIYEVTCFFGFCLFVCFFFLLQYDSTIISFCVRIEFSASMRQKRGLDWTLSKLSLLKHHKNETKNKKECTNNTTNIKVDSDGQSWRRLKRIESVGFWKIVSPTIFQSSFLLFLTFGIMLGSVFVAQETASLSFTNFFVNVEFHNA